VRSLLILTAAAAILAAFVKDNGILPVVLVAFVVVLFLGAFAVTQIITFLIDLLSLIARSALAVRGKRSRRRDLAQGTKNSILRQAGLKE
jgi:cell division protein FtsW (lipid II flippase)